MRNQDGKRTDLLGRILKTGESQVQKPDSPVFGRYQYDYFDNCGNRKHVNSWRLKPSDKTPSGHRKGKSLRELEEQIKSDLKDGLLTDKGKTTVSMAVKKSLDDKFFIKDTTRAGYEKIFRLHIEKEIGNMKVTAVKYSHVNSLYLKMLRNGLSISTITGVNSVLSPAFDMCVKNDLIRKNPCSGLMAEIIKKAEPPEKRKALTKDQQQRLVDYVRQDEIYCFYYNLLVILLGTGTRISEVLSLRWCDISFDRNIISINHSLIYYQKNGKMEYHMGTTKSKSGTREIPMLGAVRTALLSQKEFCIASGCKDSIDGFTDFVFWSRRGKLLKPSSVSAFLYNVVKAMNNQEIETAKTEGRTPDLMPKVTPHILRHTFASRLVEVENNLKVIQNILGHSTITMSMDVYAEAQSDFMQESTHRLDDALKIV